MLLRLYVSFLPCFYATVTGAACLSLVQYSHFLYINSLFLEEVCTFTGYCATMTCEIFTSFFFFWRRMGRRGKVEYAPWFPDLIILDSADTKSVLKNQGHHRTGDPNDSVYRHFTIDSAKSMSLTWTSFSTMRWSWWWSFETLRKAIQQQINVWPVCLMYSFKSVYIYIYICIYICIKPTNALY